MAGILLKRKGSCVKKYYFVCHSTFSCFADEYMDDFEREVRDSFIEIMAPTTFDASSELTDQAR